MEIFWGNAAEKNPFSKKNAGFKPEKPHLFIFFRIFIIFFLKNKFFCPETSHMNLIRGKEEGEVGDGVTVYPERRGVNQ